MGTVYRSLLMVGRELDDDDEALEMLEAAGIELSEEELEILDEDGLREVIYHREDLDGLNLEIVNCYSGDGRVFGYDLDVSPAETFADRAKALQEKWQGIFDEPADVVIFVQTS